MNNRPDTINAILGLLTGTRARNEVFGGLPKRSEIVSTLAEREIESQCDGCLVNSSHWRNEDFGTEGKADCLFVWLRADDESEDTSVAAVFDYGNDVFSYC